MTSKKSNFSDKELLKHYRKAEQEDSWFSEHIKELAKEHAGEYVAIIDKAPVAFGKDFKDAYDRAKKKFPSKIPYVAYIPKKGEEILLV